MAISVENRIIFPPPCILRPAEGFPLELGIGAGVKKTTMMRLPVRQRSLTISLAVWIECTKVTDRQTDRQKTALTHSVAR